MIGSIAHAALGRDRLTVERAGGLLVDNARARGCKRAAVETYSSAVRVQLVPFFAGRTLNRIGRREMSRRLSCT